MTSFLCNTRTIQYLQNPEAFLKIIQWIRTRIGLNDLYVLTRYLAGDRPLDDVVEDCRKEDEIEETQMPITLLSTTSSTKEQEPKKRRRRGRVSAALKARLAREYGRAWRALNPTYAKEYKEKWEAYNKTPFKKWNTIPVPKLNPITPTIAKTLKSLINSRPQQFSDGSSVTRIIAL